MIKTSTARRILATATMATVAFVGFTGAAAADTIQWAPQPGPGPIIANPEPEPQPDPPAPEPELPIAQPEPGVDPQPQPDADLPIAQPLPGGDPEPFDPPIAQPEPQPDPDPEPGPQGPGDLEADLGCTFTHGCDDDGTIDDFDSAGSDGTDVDGDGCVEIIGGPETCPEDEPGETPGDDTPADEPGTEKEDPGQLPRTGAGVLALAALGATLTAAGAATKKYAKA